MQKFRRAESNWQKKSDNGYSVQYLKYCKYKQPRWGLQFKKES